MVLLYSLSNKLEDSNYWINVLSGKEDVHEVQSYDAESILILESVKFDCDITYISVNKDIMQWMLRGNVDKFPPIQIIAVPPKPPKDYFEKETRVFGWARGHPHNKYERMNQCFSDGSNMSTKLSYAVDCIMEVLSYANKILLSRHFSILRYSSFEMNDWSDKDSDIFDREINHWYWISALRIERRAILNDRDFIFHLTSETDFATLTSKVIDQQDLEKKWTLVKNTETNIIQHQMKEYITNYTKVL